MAHLGGLCVAFDDHNDARAHAALLKSLNGNPELIKPPLRLQLLLRVAPPAPRSSWCTRALRAILLASSDRAGVALSMWDLEAVCAN